MEGVPLILWCRDGLYIQTPWIFWECDRSVHLMNVPKDSRPRCTISAILDLSIDGGSHISGSVETLTSFIAILEDLGWLSPACAVALAPKSSEGALDRSHGPVKRLMPQISDVAAVSLGVVRPSSQNVL